MISLPEPLVPVLKAVAKVGRPRLVGGCVRDALLGLTPGDWDVEVGAASFDQLQAVLARFGATDVVGRSFGTIKLRREGVVFDFSLPRRESKTGSGHRGFKVTPDPALTDAEAAARRDFTLNAMAWDPISRQLIDPHHGHADLKRRILRHTSDAFVEDPLRVLRGMQFAARFDLTIAPETAALCRSISHTYPELARERVWGEWDKWATQALKPSRGLQLLVDCDWLKHFAEIAALHGTPQDPAWHPEGDAFVHTGHCLDALIGDPEWHDAAPERRRLLTYAVLAHDFGKALTTHRAEKQGTLRWVSPGHANAGVDLALSFLARIGAPHRLLESVPPLVKYHMVHIDAGEGPFTAPFLRRLARKLTPASVADLVVVMRADSRGRPPLDPAPALETIDRLNRQARELAVADRAPSPILLGRHLIAHGLNPGPAFTPLLQEAFEAQLAGAFNDEEGSLIWLEARLKSTQN